MIPHHFNQHLGEGHGTPCPCMFKIHRGVVTSERGTRKGSPYDMWKIPEADNIGISKNTSDVSPYIFHAPTRANTTFVAMGGS